MWCLLRRRNEGWLRSQNQTAQTFDRERRWRSTFWDRPTPSSEKMAMYVRSYTSRHSRQWNGLSKEKDQRNNLFEHHGLNQQAWQAKRWLAEYHFEERWTDSKTYSIQVGVFSATCDGRRSRAVIVVRTRKTIVLRVSIAALFVRTTIRDKTERKRKRKRLLSVYTTIQHLFPMKNTLCSKRQINKLCV